MGAEAKIPRIRLDFVVQHGQSRPQLRTAGRQDLNFDAMWMIAHISVCHSYTYIYIYKYVLCIYNIYIYICTVTVLCIYVYIYDIQVYLFIDGIYITIKYTPRRSWKPNTTLDSSSLVQQNEG